MWSHMPPCAEGSSTEELLLAMTWSPVPGAVREVRRAVEASCPSGIPCCDELIVMASEVATNAVKHARTPFRVELRRSPAGFRLSVTDYAAVSVPPPLNQAGDTLALHGRGLWIIDALAAEWGVEERDASKSVWLTVNCDARVP